MLRDADFAMVNLESAVTDRGTPEPKTYHFRAPPTAYEALRAAGMPYVGARRDAAQATAPYLATVAGVRLAVLGFSQVHELAGSWRATGSRPGIAMAFDADRAVAAVVWYGDSHGTDTGC